jgi:ketosteroid isomerase-like protein
MTPDELRRELERRMRAQDLDATLELIADDAVYFWSNGVALFGKAAIAEGLKQNFSAIQFDTYETLDLTWMAHSEDAAACIYAFRWTGEIDGKAVGGGGRGSTVLRKVDGEWRVAVEHLSAGGWKPTLRGSRLPD